MKYFEGLDGLRQLAAGSVVSIGNFDGIHLGHRRILAKAAALRGKSGSGRVTVVTFEPHPLTVLRPERAPPRLTPPTMKRDLLASAGVDDYVVLSPTPEVLGLTAERFWEILRDEVRLSHLVEGESFTFGKGRGGTIPRLRAWTDGTPVRLHVIEAVEIALLNLHIAPVSSSLVRWLLAHGRARDAALCLGRAYTLEGKVIQGFQRGRTIGTPTANLDCGDQLIPADGVYAARSIVDGITYPVALSIGTMPTFGPNARQIEAHLIGFSGDLYGQALQVQIVDWLREQWKFNGLEPLKSQIARDIQEASQRQADDPTRPISSMTTVL